MDGPRIDRQRLHDGDGEGRSSRGADRGNGGRAHGGNGHKSAKAARHEVLRETVRSLSLGEPLVDGALSVVPLYCGFRSTSKYVLLQQALERGTMTITEVSEEGSVPTLSAMNKGPWPVLIFDGEELAGAKQNRIANATILVGVGKTVLPVSCVEQGRWSHRTASFDAGSYASHPSLRREKERQVMACLLSEDALRAEADGDPQAMRAMRYRSDQGRVWAEVARTQREMGVRSETGALNDTFEAGRDRLESILQNLNMQTPQGDSKSGGSHRGGRPVGVAVFIGKQFVCLDLLRPGGRFQMLYPKLLRGYALEALLRKARASKSFDPEAATVRLLAEVMEAQVTQQPSADQGQDLRLEGKQLAGSGLEWQDELVQVSLFPKVVA